MMKHFTQKPDINENDSDLKLAQTVAHDLKSPITALIVAWEDLPKSKQSKLMKQAIHRIFYLVELFLEQSKSQSEELGKILKGFSFEQSLQEVVEGIVEEKEHRYQSDLIEFQIEILAQSHRHMPNAQALHRVLSNLLDNAVKATKPGRKNLVTVSVEEKADLLWIEIRDSGCGIAKKNLSLIENYGISGDLSNGYGIGLFQVKKAVHSWGGTFEIDSELNQGTTIRFSLPLAENSGQHTSHQKTAINLRARHDQTV